MQPSSQTTYQHQLSPQPASRQPTGRRVLLAVNCASRQGEECAADAGRLLREHGMEVISKMLRKETDLEELLAQYKSQVDFVVIGGGDGTLNAAAGPLRDAQLPVGILPLGTANDLARTLGIPTDLKQACQVIADGHLQRIDLGEVNGHPFFNVSSLGLGVEITRQLTKEAKRRWGVFAYLFTAIRVLRNSRPFWARITCDGKIRDVKTVHIAVGNGRFHGGGMAVASDARIDDSRLDAYCLETRHWIQVLWIWPSMRRGELQKCRYASCFRGKEITVATRRRRAINTDGEIRTETPAHYRVVPQCLTVFVPRPGEKD